MNSKELELLEQVMAGVKELPEIDPRPDFTRQIMFAIKEKEEPGCFVFPSHFISQLRKLTGFEKYRV